MQAFWTSLDGLTARPNRNYKVVDVPAAALKERPYSLS